MELLRVIRAKLVEQMRAQQAATPQTPQTQPQSQIEPLPESPQSLQPQPEPRPQPQPAQQEQPLQTQPASVVTGLVSFQLRRSSSEALRHTLRPTVLPSPGYPNSSNFSNV